MMPALVAMPPAASRSGPVSSWVMPPALLAPVDRDIAAVDVGPAAREHQVPAGDRDDGVVGHAAGAGERAEADELPVVQQRPIPGQRPAGEVDRTPLDIDADRAVAGD